MAKHLSVQKANRQNIKLRQHNRDLRSRLRTAIKSIRVALETKDINKANDTIRGTTSLIDKMAGKKIIHHNTASRYKSRLTKQLEKLSAQT